jgi:hypothetical protein
MAGCSRPIGAVTGTVVGGTEAGAVVVGGPVVGVSVVGGAVVGGPVVGATVVVRPVVGAASLVEGPSSPPHAARETTTSDTMTSETTARVALAPVRTRVADMGASSPLWDTSIRRADQRGCPGSKVVDE